MGETQCSVLAGSGGLVGAWTTFVDMGTPDPGSVCRFVVRPQKARDRLSLDRMAGERQNQQQHEDASHLSRVRQEKPPSAESLVTRSILSAKSILQSRFGREVYAFDRRLSRSRTRDSNVPPVDRSSSSASIFPEDLVTGRDLSSAGEITTGPDGIFAVRALAGTG